MDVYSLGCHSRTLIVRFILCMTHKKRNVEPFCRSLHAIKALALPSLSERATYESPTPMYVYGLPALAECGLVPYGANKGCHRYIPQGRRRCLAFDRLM